MLGRKAKRYLSLLFFSRSCGSQLCRVYMYVRIENGLGIFSPGYFARREKVDLDALEPFKRRLCDVCDARVCRWINPLSPHSTYVSASVLREIHFPTCVRRTNDTHIRFLYTEQLHLSSPR